MSKDRVLTQESFDNLLRWLDSDRERAGTRYEEIRRRLIRIFTCRGSGESEDLTDETINRVALKVTEVSGSYRGDPALYFYGVAQNVFRESLRRRPPPPLPPSYSRDVDDDEDEDEYRCLEQCLQHLPEQNRHLILQYYVDEKQARIDHRRLMAEQMGIAINALRIRAHRLRADLQQCVENCLSQVRAG